MSRNINYTTRQGDTEAINITLQSAGSAADITGYTSISAFFESTRSAAQTAEFSTGAGDLTVSSAATGSIAIEPGVSSFLSAYSPYQGYIVVVDGTGKRSSFPEDGQIVFKILERLSIDD